MKVTDAANNTATKALSIAVAAAPQPPTITTTSLPGGTTGTAYSTTLQASSGTTPYTWSLSAGTLPAGLSLAASTGVISGTPTTAGTVSFTVKVTDAANNTATKALSIAVTAAVTPVQISTTSVPAGQVGVSYSTMIQATGGTTPYSWSISSGALPAGLTLTAGTGSISGTPTASGSFSFTAKVTDSTSPAQSATKAFSSHNRGRSESGANHNLLAPIWASEHRLLDHLGRFQWRHSLQLEHHFRLAARRSHAHCGDRRDFRHTHHRRNFQLYGQSY